MSTVAISYHDLNQTARKANQVAQKLDNYASGINSKIINKLNNYQGGYSSDISSAINIAKQKVEILEEQAERQRAFANDLYALEDQCKAVDRAVKSKISNLTASFRDKFNIKIGTMDRVYSTVVSVFNSNVVTRHIKDGLTYVNEWGNSLRSNIKHWYNYQGGKAFIKGAAVAALKIVIGVATIAKYVGMIIAGAALGPVGIVVLIASLVGGAIMFANGVSDICHEWQATKADNPFVAKKLRNINSFEDSLREDNHHGLANIVKGAELVSGVITITAGLAKGANQAYRWATNSAGSIKKLSDLKVLAQGGALKFKKSLFDTKIAIRDGGLKVLGKDLLINAKTNLASKYLNFSSFTNKMDSIKASASLSKDLVEGKEIGFSLLTKVVLPSVTAFDNVLKAKPEIVAEPTGQLKIEFFETVTLGDLTDPFVDIRDTIKENILNQKK